MHSKQKGSIGVAAIALDIMSLGHSVFIEFGDLSKTDLIVLINDKTPIKVQVKSCTSHKGAVLLYRKSDGPGYHYLYDDGMVDVFALYCLDTKDIIYVTSDELVKGFTNVMTFRLTSTKNHQTKGIRFASDYRSFERILRGHTWDTLSHQCEGKDMVQTATEMASES